MERRGRLRHRRLKLKQRKWFAPFAPPRDIRGVGRIEAQASAHRRAIQTVRSINHPDKLAHLGHPLSPLDHARSRAGMTHGLTRCE
jgi:hypothetical protein